jgi:selenocysteine-specific elongation factor
VLVATAGHVDHGKTLLVRALTGVDTDRLPEEQRRGLTIDLGFAYQDLGEGHTLGFVDVPGHERFVRNMLAGVAAIDFGLLIVAVDDGPMPQTREHLAILDLLGIGQVSVALTKIDKVDEQRVAEVARLVEDLLDGSKFAGAPVFPISALTNAGMDALRQHLREAAETHRMRTANGNFRLAVDRSFTVSGAGLVVTGAVFSGKIAVGNRVLLSPASVEVRVRAIHAHNLPTQEGRAGQRCAINLAGSDLKKADIHRGDWLVAPSLTATTRRFDARLRVLPSEVRALSHWTPVHVHLGAASLTGRIAVLEDRSIAPGAQGLVQILLDQATSAVHGDRFVLRDQSARRTIAGGTVIDPLSPARGRARPARIAFLKTMETRDTTQALTQLLDQERDGIDLDDFQAARNLTPEEAVACVSDARAMLVSVRRARIGISIERWNGLHDGLLEVLRGWHEEHPDVVGPDDARLRQSFTGQISRALLGAALESLIREGVIIREGSSLRLESHSPTLSREEAALWKSVERHVSEQVLRPPVVTELAQRLQVEVQALDAFLGRSVGRGQLVRLARNRCFHPRAIAQLAYVAEQLAGECESGLFDAKSYRDRSGLGRNLAIQVLEYFDAAGLTMRVGDVRKVVGTAEKLFGKPAR